MSGRFLKEIKGSIQIYFGIGALCPAIKILLANIPIFLDKRYGEG